MATKKAIITLPHNSLRKRSQKVGYINKEIEKIISDMKSATIDWENSRDHEVAVALAAVQIDKLYKIIIIRDNPDDKKDQRFTVLINPTITKYEGTTETDFEGCLSIKNIYGRVPRHTKVKIKAIGVDGKEFRVTAEGFLSRVLQHEIDHTKGVLFIDHIKDDPDAFYKLKSDGHLEKLDYVKDIQHSSVLW